MTVIKFTYKDQIHSAPELPTTLEAVHAVISEIFGSALPAQYILNYKNPHGQTTPITNEEDYQKLKEENVETEVSIIIETVRDPAYLTGQIPIEQLNIGENAQNQAQGYPSLAGYQDPNRIDVDALNMQRNQVNDRYKSINRQFAEYLADIHAMPELQINPEHRERVTVIIQQRLHALMTDIISSSNRAVLKDEVVTSGRPQGAKRASVLDQGADFLSKMPSFIDKGMDEGTQFFSKVPSYVEKGVDKAKKLPGFFEKHIDTISQKLAGDPYVETADGRYPKSVILKADQLKPLLPPEITTKEVLEYIRESPKDAGIQALVDFYPTYRQLKDAKNVQSEPHVEGQTPFVNNQ